LAVLRRTVIFQSQKTRTRHTNPVEFSQNWKDCTQIFFPAPAELLFDKKGKLIGMKPIANGALTKEELKTLYDRECGGILHKGTLKNLRPRTVDFDRVREWDIKIVRLLNSHHIKLVTPKTQMWVRMNSLDHGGKVAAHIVEASWSGPGLEPLRGN
jgi:hypothetical protein